MSIPKSLKGVTRYILTFYRTASSYDWKELEDALRKRGYEIVVNQQNDDEIIADVYLKNINSLIPLVSLCEANNWEVGYSNEPNKRLITTYIRGQISIIKV
ncbi:MAG: hypothetical protein KQA41_03345 [Candidatus Aenigmarchaeota archaeon]|nr:hypothetical protein [Candidatus Aenigmarchaeota archaeon]MBU5689232.1 hypothetical protein [Candidatus Aenigmarchaeota archaeon]